MLLLARRTPSATLRRMRSSVAVIVAMSFAFLPQVVGFGLSGIGLRPAINGALVPRASAAALEQTIGWEGKQQSRNWRRRAQEISCRVSSPRRYGSADWFSNIQNLPKSRLLYNIKGHLFYNTAFAFAVSLVHLLTPQHIIDDLHVSAIPHSIMSGALGLLLVFRTNAAYNRFWEARKIWGGLINTCRNIARLGAVALGPDSAEWLEIKEYIRMFPFLLKQHLQDVRVDEELDWVSLPPADIIRLQEDPNPPMFALQKITEILAGAYADGGAGQSMGGRVPDLTSVTYRMEIERHLSSLMDALGKCERILTTPVPRGYSRHTSRFLTVYGFTLPIVLVPHTELFTAPVVAAVCWGLFSIEEIAYFIEQPFDPEYRQLDLMGFSEKVARDIERMTVSSSLGGGGGEGSSSSPRLPVAAATGVTTAAHGDGLVQSSYEPKLQELNLEVPLTEVNGGSANNVVNGHAASEIKGHNGFGRKGWGIGGGRAGSGHLDVVRSGGEEDRAEAEEGKRSKVDGLLQSWRGNRDDDPV